MKKNNFNKHPTFAQFHKNLILKKQTKKVLMSPLLSFNSLLDGLDGSSEGINEFLRENKLRIFSQVLYFED